MGIEHNFLTNSSLMNLPKVRSVVSNSSDPNGDRLLLLRVSDEGTNFHNISVGFVFIGPICKPAQLTPEAREYLNAESAELTTYTLELDYDYWSTGERLIILDIRWLIFFL
jgi:tRNA (guanine37-N1)-methyltransferase